MFQTTGVRIGYSVHRSTHKMFKSFICYNLSIGNGPHGNPGARVEYIPTVTISIQASVSGRPLLPLDPNVCGVP